MYNSKFHLAWFSPVRSFLPPFQLRSSSFGHFLKEHCVVFPEARFLGRGDVNHWVGMIGAKSNADYWDEYIGDVNLLFRQWFISGWIWYNMSMSRSTDEYSVPCLEMFPFFWTRYMPCRWCFERVGLRNVGELRHLISPCFFFLRLGSWSNMTMKLWNYE